MEQEKLEKKVRDILGREGFEIEDGVARKPEVKLELGVYSSEKYDEEEIDHSKDKIFVDKGLQNVEDAYVVEEEKEYDLPSFELIGDIAVINDLSSRDREEAVEGILAHHDVKTILLKTEGLSGEFRVGSYETLYGEETETVHKEHGYRFKVDPTKAYYSERFSTERERVASQVKEGEKVLVMFAGVGPFAILCSEKAEKVVAIEKNPEAYKYLAENIGLNDVEDKVEVYCGDVKDIIPELDGRFDRVIMPLPEKAVEFLDEAVEKVEKGGTVHLYTFVEDEKFGPVQKEIENIFDNNDLDFDIVDKFRCGYKSPSEDRYCFDIKVFE